MALYDNQFDWYDMFVPGSQIVPLAHSAVEFFKSPNLKEDVSDFLGFGSARRQREYETDLANTAYQRQVEDMRAAGLNPYLAYSQGGAAVPQGSVGQSHLGDVLKLVGTALMLSKGITSSAKGLSNSASRVTTIRNYFYK